MGNISKLIKRMQKTKQEFDEQMNKHIQELGKIRQVVKYNYIPKENIPRSFWDKPKYCHNCGGKF